MSATTIHLLRHGETVTPDRLCGRTDVAVTAKGHASVVRRLGALAPQRLISSPRQRAQRPATEHAEVHGVALNIDPRWAEIDVGIWEDRTFADIRANDGERFAAYAASPETVTAPDGETWQDFTSRIRGGLSDLIGAAPSPAGAADEGAPPTIVCHAGVIRAVLSEACGFTARQAWAIHVGYACLVTMKVGLDDTGKLWGQLISLSQDDA